MAVQDRKLVSKISLGASSNPSARTRIPSTGPSGTQDTPTQTGKLKSKISLSPSAQKTGSATANQVSPASEVSHVAVVPETDYRAEADYRNGPMPQVEAGDLTEPISQAVGNQPPHDGYHGESNQQPDVTPSEFDYRPSADGNDTDIYNIDERMIQYDDEYEITDDAQYQDDFIYDVTATELGSMDAYEMSQEYKDASSGRKKIYKRASIVFFIVFVLSGTLLALMVGTNWLKNKAYVDLSSEMNIPMTDETTESTVHVAKQEAETRNWAALRAENPDIKYWLNVEHKPINYPLVQHPTDQSYYLKHDFWKEYSNAGTPFIDYRNFPATDKHLLTYGHHITGSDTMYSTVNKAWDQSEFDEIGKVTLEAPTDTDGTSYEIFYPAFAFMVDQSYQTIQEFDFADDNAFRQWLQGMSREASAKNEWTDYLIRNARRSLTFVTCASDTPNQRERTLIIFISVAAPSTSYDDANFLPQDVAQLVSQQQGAPTEGAFSNQGTDQVVSGHPQIATALNPIRWLTRNTGVPTLGVTDSPLLSGKSTR